MIKWFLAIQQIIREIEKKSNDALKLYPKGGKKATKSLNDYIRSDCTALETLWEQQFKGKSLGDIWRHIHFGEDCDYRSIIESDLPAIEKQAEELLLKSDTEERPLGFETLLHLVVLKSSYKLFREGHYREAVLNSVVAVFDYIRARTALYEDGANLVGKVFSLENPVLVLSEVDTESGQNDQKGFLQIFSGAYQGIRNTKSHSLFHDLTEHKAAQYLVFSSLLARRVEEANLRTTRRKAKKRGDRQRS